MSLKETVKMLLDYKYNDNDDKPIAIVGPDGSNEDELRVYAFGGLIGLVRISDGEFIIRKDDDYDTYLKAEEYDYGSYRKKRKNDLSVLIKIYGEKDYIEEFHSIKSGSKQINIKVYLDYIVTAAYNRHRRCDPVTKQYEPYTPSEKVEQCKITHRFMGNGQKRGWCICDFEYQDNTYRTKSQIGGRIDLVVYDYKRKQFGLIELKLTNDSTNNIEKHYNDSKKLINNKSVINNIKKRCISLEKAGLIDAIGNNKEDEMWFGFLFVGDCQKTSAKLIDNRSEVFADKERKYCRFRYIENIEQLETNGLTFDSMESFDKFTGKAK